MVREHGDRPYVERKRDREASAAFTEGSTRTTTPERDGSAAVVWERAVEGLDGRLRLFRLPAYSPGLSPEERV